MYGKSGRPTTGNQADTTETLKFALSGGIILDIRGAAISEVRFMEQNYNEYGTNRRFNIPPVALVIFAVIVIAGCFIGIWCVYSKYYDDESFKNAAGTAEAVCTEKDVYSQGDGAEAVTHYIMLIEFHTEEDESGEPYQVVLDETAESFKDISVGDTIDVYYDKENPQICRPVIFFGDPVPAYVIFGIIIFAALILAGINLNTIIRNIHGYTPKFTKPDDIGYTGGGTSDVVGDSNVDYNSADVFNNSVMDSYADPFATYSGYDENQNTEVTDGAYFDPNSGYSGNGDIHVNNDVPRTGDINNPFLTNINTDPNNPFNTDLQSINNNDADLNDPFAIYGDSSFGAAVNPDNE